MFKVFAGVLSSFFVALVLSGCQTTGIANLDTPDARAGIRLINEACMTTTGSVDIAYKNYDIKDESTSIHYISRGEDNWWKFGMRTRGFGGWIQGYFFANSKTKKIACGEKSFKKKGYVFSYIEVPSEPDAFVKELKGEGV